MIKSRNKFLTIIITSFFVMISVYAVKHFKTKPSVASQMAAMASEFNKSCPMTVDSQTRLDNAFVASDNVFQYNYTLINLIKEQIDLPTLYGAKPEIINDVKTNPALKFFRENNITLRYSYKDKTGQFVALIEVAPTDYK